jgi:hypothetical protein
MLGALILLPALACFLLPSSSFGNAKAKLPEESASSGVTPRKFMVEAK